MVVWRPNFVTSLLPSLSPPPGPPLPTDADYNPVDKTLRVYFDKELMTGTLDAANWEMKWNNERRRMNTAYANPDHVFCQTFYIGWCPTAKVCSYDPPPYDVKNLWGEPAEAFSDFPVH